MNITIVGAGNMGLALTGYLALKRKYNVTLFTEKEILKDGALKVVDAEKHTTEFTSDFKIDSSSDALLEADYILCTYPAFLRKKFVEKWGVFLQKDTRLGFVPGYGGADFFCKDLIKRGVVVFALQRVPYVARVDKWEKGREARILSKKVRLYAAAFPHSCTGEVSCILEEMLDIPCVGLQEYLSITLAPSNPLLHITGLYNVFKDHGKEDSIFSPLKFYEEWNDETSCLLFKYDEELQNICSALTPINLTEVVPLPVYYQSDTPEKMTRKLKSIESFKVVNVPLKKMESGYTVDLGSRMFVEDFPYGVCIIKDFARIANVKTPVIDMLLQFYTRLSGHKYFEKDGSYTAEIQKTGIPGIYGINTVEDIISFYHDGR